MHKKIILISILTAAILGANCALYATELEDRLYLDAQPYIKYYTNRHLPDANQAPDNFNFNGLTLSHQLNLGGSDYAGEALKEHGAGAYDMSVLGRIELSGGITTILDTYVSYNNQLNNPNNPLIDCANNYYGAGGTGDVINHGAWWNIRITGRDEPNWWDGQKWDWRTDTGATACLITYAAEGYNKFAAADPARALGYKNLAMTFGEYLLKLQDTDGGIRFGPKGMWHSGSIDGAWSTKSTEQNERCKYAFSSLYAITSDSKWLDAENKVKIWLKSMYDFRRHLFYTGATYQFKNKSWEWVNLKTVTSDSIGLAPIDLMLTDLFFGATQEKRDKEVDKMFKTVERRLGIKKRGQTVLFKFSNRQFRGKWGSVEWSSQAAMGYLKAAQIHNALGNPAKTGEYLGKYYGMLNSLLGFFSTPADDPLDPYDDAGSLIAPPASYLDGGVAGNMWIGFWNSANCQGYISSAYFAFAKAGYDPYALGGGTGIPGKKKK